MWHYINRSSEALIVRTKSLFLLTSGRGCLLLFAVSSEKWSLSLASQRSKSSCMSGFPLSILGLQIIERVSQTFAACPLTKRLL